MKKIFCSVLALVICAASAKADEGMWLLPLLQKMNAKALSQAGCKLSPEEIYSVNNSSLKDAIVQFGGGCTGEIVSDQGLLLTNHHCGYSSIQQLSSVEHDYLANGYWAMNRSEELPVPGLSVTFMERMSDVTKALDKVREKALKENVEDVEAVVKEAKSALISAAEASVPGSKAEVVNFYNENVQYLIVYKTYNDIRFVGAPPSSIGKFGADTDNWMWPRHTCDFSMFRVYAGADNQPAEYSEDNVPYTPKKHLSISLKGVNEGDFTMIMGFPGRTTRFQTSPELKSQILTNDIRIAARTVRQNIMMEEMLADPAVKIQYASKYSSSSNGWKKWQGMKLAFDKLDIIGRAEQEEDDFNQWVSANKKRSAKYGTVVADIRDCIEEMEATREAFTLSFETLYRIELISYAYRYKHTFARLLKGTDNDSLAAHNRTVAYLADLYKDYSPKLDRRVAGALVDFYRANAFEDLLVDDLDVDALYDNSVFTSLEKLEAAGASAINDPAIAVAEQYMSIVYGTNAGVNEYSEKLAGLQKLYTEGLLEWRKGQASYPDANFTMRFTYGHVMPYSPKDAVIYRHYTTLDGVMEKEDPNNWEFVVPEKLKEIWKTSDYGDYAMADGKMPACFLSNNDITGGNSGSPIMNAEGQLIGLAFDGNWESMSSDVMFEPQLQRCINVDIRYVLLIVDKFGGASWLLDEMTIIK